MNFTEDDILARMGRSSPFLRENNIPITLSSSVKNSRCHNNKWCSVAIVYDYNGHRIEEPKWNIRIPEVQDRKAFASLLSEVCSNLNVQFVEPDWQGLVNIDK